MSLIEHPVVLTPCYEMSNVPALTAVSLSSCLSESNGHAEP
jgi:hypothetical protein